MCELCELGGGVEDDDEIEEVTSPGFAGSWLVVVAAVLESPVGFRS